MSGGRHQGAVGLAIVIVLAPAARALDPDDAAIKKAVAKGVAYLRSTQTEAGRWPHDQIGATALAGLALVECGVRRDDPSVQKAAEVVREASLTMVQTYSLALSIMFLDRLGESHDVLLIES